MSTLKRTARTTGLLYLALAITGMVGYLLIRNVLHDPDSAAQTLANLTEREGLARLGVAFEVAMVLSQALVAVWFFKLFRSVNSVAAGAIAAFGLVNAVVILASSVALSTALAVALDPSLAPGGDAAASVQSLYSVSDGLWNGGAVFFGLWLIPMGYAVMQSGWMPRMLGNLLIVSGVGYILSALVQILFPTVDSMSLILTLPATVGEFWILGYLIIIGVRKTALTQAPQATSTH